jgi:hypothetical protein
MSNSTGMMACEIPTNDGGRCGGGLTRFEGGCIRCGKHVQMYREEHGIVSKTSLKKAPKLTKQKVHKKVPKKSDDKSYTYYNEYDSESYSSDLDIESNSAESNTSSYDDSFEYSSDNSDSDSNSSTEESQNEPIKRKFNDDGNNTQKSIKKRKFRDCRSKTIVIDLTQEEEVFDDFINTNFKCTHKNSDFESIDMLYSALKHWYTDSYTGKCPYTKKDLIGYFISNNFKCDEKYLYQYAFSS